MRATSPAALDRHARLARRRSLRRTLAVTAGITAGLVAVVGVGSVVPLSAAEAAGSPSGIALASFTTPIEPVALVTDDGTDEISTAARDALDAATTSAEAAAQVEADIDEAGLDIGTDDTTIDLAALSSAATRLEAGLDMPAPLVPSLTEKVTAALASVDERVSQLRSALDAAEKKKAAEEAAKKKAAAEAAKKAAEEKAAAEAAAAAAAEQASSQTSTAAPAPAPAYAAAGTSAAEAQAIAKSMLSSYGWGGDQFSCLVSLWNKESGWNASAYNASSGAFGIPQALPGSKMATAGADWQTNAATQIRWGLGYIQGRYGSPCGAWGHSQSVGWY